MRIFAFAQALAAVRQMGSHRRPRRIYILLIDGFVDALVLAVDKL